MMKRPSVLPARDNARGFTLIELMVAVAIVAILASIALPAYTDYVLRSKIPDGTNALSALRARMEQYYQDNRSYLSKNGQKSPCDNPGTSGKGYFTLECTKLTSTEYVIQATGVKGAAGFIFTIDNTGTEGTRRVPPAWGGDVTANCWVTKRGETC